MISCTPAGGTRHRLVDLWSAQPDKENRIEIVINYLRQPLCEEVQSKIIDHLELIAILVSDSSYIDITTLQKMMCKCCSGSRMTEKFWTFIRRKLQTVSQKVFENVKNSFKNFNMRVHCRTVLKYYMLISCTRSDKEMGLISVSL